jgi:hypothetical protein
VNFQCYGEPVRRSPRQSGSLYQLGERRWPVVERIQDANRFIEDANSAIVFHVVKLPSQGVRSG